MKILFDTSVLVAALVQPHPLHHHALSWFRKARAGEFELIVSSHTIAELYAVLSTLPVSPRITPGLAWQLIHENVEPVASVISLSSSDYFATIRRMSDLGISGGAIYDALIVKTAQKSVVDRVLTLNVNDFKRIWPEGEKRIAAP
jgi:predicted nucleic acid-binding protein